MNRKIVIEHFSSLYELASINRSRSPNSVFRGEKLSSEDNDNDFTGTSSYDEAENLMRCGYKEPIEKFQRCVNVALRSMPSKRITIHNDIVGFAPCVPNAIIGAPNSMISSSMKSHNSKIIDIVYDADAPGCVEKSVFIDSGAAVLSLINYLEHNGFRCSLRLIFCNAEAGEQSIFTTVNLKQHRQPLDLLKMTFPFCHPSMLRRMGFKWTETNPDITDTGFRRSYGRAWTHSTPFKKVAHQLKTNKCIKQNDIYINIPFCREHNYEVLPMLKDLGLTE